MSFASPIFLLGLFGVLIPLIIHLWKMRRAKTVRFAAIRYLLESEQVTRRRRKFWEYLLLLVRMLIIAGLSLALAKPYRMESVPALSLGNEQKSLVIIIDDSLSMQRKAAGGSLFEQGKNVAISALNQLTDLDQAALIFPCAGEESEFSKDRELNKRRVRAAQPSFQRARMLSWLGRAEEMLARSGAKSKKILVITDLQNASFSDGLNLSAFDGEIYFYDLGKENGEKNLALGAAELSRESISGEESVKVLARVYNFSDESAQVRLNLELGDQVLSRGSAELGRFGSAEKTFVINLRENMSAEGKIEIENQDALDLDNQSWFHLRGGGRVRALVVDGDWSTELSSRQSYFLERALNPRLYALSRIDPEVVSENGMAQADFNNYQVIVLADCYLSDKAQVERIRSFVNAGGGLLITLGAKVDADRYNKLLADLLPREIREVKVPFAGAEGAKEIQPMHIDSGFIGLPERHPILRPFNSANSGDPAAASFYKYFLLYQELVPKGQAVLKLADGSPILMEKNYGQGDVVLFASSINRDWNDLCIHPAFLPLFHQTIFYLARSLYEIGAKGATVGEQIELTLPAGKSGALARTSRGTEMNLNPDKQAGKSVVRINRLLEPGIYYFWYLPGPLPRTKENADFILAVNPDPQESDFRKISASDLKKLAPASALFIQTERGEKPAPGSQAKTSFIKKPYHPSFLLLLIILAGLEILILVRSGRE